LKQRELVACDVMSRWGLPVLLKTMRTPSIKMLNGVHCSFHDLTHFKTQRRALATARGSSAILWLYGKRAFDAGHARV